MGLDELLRQKHLEDMTKAASSAQSDDESVVIIATMDVDNGTDDKVVDFDDKLEDESTNLETEIEDDYIDEVDAELVDELVMEPQVIAEPKVVKPKIAPKKTTVKITKARVDSKFEYDVVQIRSFPKSLLLEAKRCYPEANNQTDAIAAYMYANSGKALDVPAHIKEMVVGKKDETLPNMEKHLDSLSKQVFILTKQLNELSLITGYLAFDRLGFRHDRPKNPASVNLLEPGMESMLTTITDQTKQYQQKKAIKNGRPIK